MKKTYSIYIFLIKKDKGLYTVAATIIIIIIERMLGVFIIVFVGAVVTR